MIELNDSLLLGEGNERYCYLHPNDPLKVIKIEKSHKSKKQNKIDSIYYRHLARQKVDFSSISKCYQWEDTSLGEGLVFERVTNYDQSPVLSFEEVVVQKLLSQEQQIKLMKELELYLRKNNILFIDVSLSNIICKKVSDKKWLLVIIDGLGARRLKLKFWFQRNIKIYAQYKVRKQWKVFLENHRQLTV